MREAIICLVRAAFGASPWHGSEFVSVLPACSRRTSTPCVQCLVGRIYHADRKWRSHTGGGSGILKDFDRRQLWAALECAHHRLTEHSFGPDRALHCIFFPFDLALSSNDCCYSHARGPCCMGQTSCMGLSFSVFYSCRSVLLFAGIKRTINLCTFVRRWASIPVIQPPCIRVGQDDVTIFWSSGVKAWLPN